jgi:hypothetical protein
MVGTAPRFENPGINAAPVVADSQTKLAGVVGNLHFDVTAAGVGEGVGECFAPDGKGFFEDDRV